MTHISLAITWVFTLAYSSDKPKELYHLNERYAIGYVGNTACTSMLSF